MADNQGWTAYTGNLYTPTNQLYRWTGGTSGQTIVDKTYNKHYASFFGLFKLWSTGSTDELIAQTVDVRGVGLTLLFHLNLDGSLFVSKLDGHGNQPFLCLLSL